MKPSKHQRRQRPNVERLYASLSQGYPHGIVLNLRQVQAWICRTRNLASRQAVDAWISAMEDFGMIRRTTDGNIQLVQPALPPADDAQHGANSGGVS